SGKHALALTNLGSATTADILALAAEITERVESIFGVRLQPEPRIPELTSGGRLAFAG
ncbi:MAG: hypothetical protein M3400_00100, partial [Actinomycetota bacterium]|nr:hypothetical protein [Actinomycetota bacterium]